MSPTGQRQVLNRAGDRRQTIPVFHPMHVPHRGAQPMAHQGLPPPQVQKNAESGPQRWCPRAMITGLGALPDSRLRSENARLGGPSRGRMNHRAENRLIKTCHTQILAGRWMPRCGCRCPMVVALNAWACQVAVGLPDPVFYPYIPAYLESGAEARYPTLDSLSARPGTGGPLAAESAVSMTHIAWLLGKVKDEGLQ